MKCPECNHEIKSTWFKNSHLVHCQNCGLVFHVNKPSKVAIKVYEPLSTFNFANDDRPKDTFIPDFEDGELVFCVDSRHDKFLDYGKVCQLDHMHVRVHYPDMKLWLPHNVIQKVPEEWI